MGGWTGIWQWIVVLAIVLLLFGGRGKISQLMGDFGKGLRSFKKGLKDGEGEPQAAGEPQKTIEGEATPAVNETANKDQPAAGG